MGNLITYSGKIVFEPENITAKHGKQASWKRIAMVLFEGEITQYYSWFLKRRFSLELNKPLRSAHVSFINDAIEDFNECSGTNEEKELLWNSAKKKWDGKNIDVVLNTEMYSNIEHYWLIVDNQHREGLHNIRKEMGLGEPYFGLHMSVGYCNDKNMLHSEYLQKLYEKGLIDDVTFL